LLQQASKCSTVASVSRLVGLLRCGAALVLAGCGAPTAAPAAWAQPVESAAAPVPVLPIAAQPDVELRHPRVALVHGQPVPFDGTDGGRQWPALAIAVGPRKEGDVVILDVARDVPVGDLLRAAWSLRSADVHVQSPDPSGTLRAVEFRARREGAPGPGCHLAVFLRADGTLRIAAPGGPRDIAGERPAQSLAHSLVEERARCPITYVAFGAESDDAAWGPVFDVVVAVDEQKSAGDARYVLGHAVHRRQ
jgi:hypothetical protein